MRDPDQLRSTAQKCRWLAGQSDEETRGTLLALAEDYEQEARALEMPAYQPAAEAERRTD